jgi:hypothetical protein
MLKLIGLATVAGVSWWGYQRIQDAKRLGIDPMDALKNWTTPIGELAALLDAAAQQGAPQVAPTSTGDAYDPDGIMTPDWLDE